MAGSGQWSGLGLPAGHEGAGGDGRAGVHDLPEVACNQHADVAFICSRRVSRRNHSAPVSRITAPDEGPRRAGRHDGSGEVTEQVG